MIDAWCLRRTKTLIADQLPLKGNTLYLKYIHYLVWCRELSRILIREVRVVLRGNQNSLNFTYAKMEFYCHILNSQVT